MDYINLKANAKINLALDVINKREDGYHNLRMIMQTLRLHDEVFMKKISSSKLEIRTNIKQLPTDEKNLVYQAVDLIQRNYDVGGVYVEITKNIPIAAGLAGGSADCAAALVGMKKLFNLRISNDELLDIGKSLGADVPYCIVQGTALAEGIGEKLTELPSHPSVLVLVVKPNISVSTASVFESLNFNNIEKRPDIDKMIKDIENGDINSISSGFCNVLETVTETKYPIIQDIKKVMYNNNSIGALMSGSGPTVFGYFKTKEDACCAIKEIKLNMQGVKEIYLTGIFNRARRSKRG